MQGFFQEYLSVYRPLISKLNELLGKFELSYSLWQVIWYVKKNGQSSLVDISNYYNVEKPTITRAVKRLEEKLILKVIPGKDKREKVVQLTELGEDLYQTIRQKITELEYSVMSGIPKEEQNAAFQVLPKFRKNILKEGRKDE
ncbi:winged helix DNA-binding protein [Neobacillus cucumis]|uniref:MarR family winged helix-turn-helix transcriptional regulator n=1 Tax=Neobacillus cucumis TaxID=1740721 RepID=UPI0018DF0E21|nr:winged helix DNA-binding protein [Neobacillus cucumis]MBI0576878.1 winged helix DNA-binding protein [Neobacillus cucumis]